MSHGGLEVLGNYFDRKSETRGLFFFSWIGYSNLIQIRWWMTRMQDFSPVRTWDLLQILSWIMTLLTIKIIIISTLIIFHKWSDAVFNIKMSYYLKCTIWAQWPRTTHRFQITTCNPRIRWYLFFKSKYLIFSI